MCVAVPDDGAVALLSGLGRACEVDHALLVCSLALMFVYAHGVIEGVELASFMTEGIAETLAAQFEALCVAVPGVCLAPVAPVCIDGFGRVAPPGVKSVAEELPVGIVPIQVACGRREGVVDIGARHEHAPCGEVFLLRRIGHAGPDGNHQFGIHAVDGIRQGSLVGIVARVHLHVSPASRLPVVPVLHDHVDRYVAVAKTLERADEVCRADIPLLRLSVAKEIKGHHQNTGHLRFQLMEKIIM